MTQGIFILGNGVDWCRKCLLGFDNMPNTYLVNCKIPVNGLIKKEIAKFFFSHKINKYIHIPFKYLFYNQIINRIRFFSHGKKIKIIIFDHNKFGGEEEFISLLKHENIVECVCYVFTNIVKYSAAREFGYLDKLNDWYDVVFAFDPEDAKEYGFSYSPLIYDADPNYKREEKESKEDLVFYVGQAKDRLPGLLSCFEKLKQLGIKTDFHIANVKEEDIKYSDEIIYNKFMTYAECVASIQKATCLIDVIQGESTGLTIKTCEAVCYDKKLITTNKHVVDYPFYDPRYIRIVESPDDIDESFFIENKDVHYSEEAKRYFSANSFIERLEKELNKDKKL